MSEQTEILNIFDLAREYGCDDVTEENAAESIKRTVYKYTDCGCSFNCGNDFVAVSGYCEGSDAELTNHRLDFPFKLKEWYDALSSADSEGTEIWKQTHGCEECWPDGCCSEVEELEFGCWPINPKCEHCEGEGAIL